MNEYSKTPLTDYSGSISIDFPLSEELESILLAFHDTLRGCLDNYRHATVLLAIPADTKGV
jgi:hypothetical protein